MTSAIGNAAQNRVPFLSKKRNKKQNGSGNRRSRKKEIRTGEYTLFNPCNTPWIEIEIPMKIYPEDAIYNALLHLLMSSSFSVAEEVTVKANKELIGPAKDS